MDIEPKENDVTDIDVLDPVGDNAVIILKDAEEAAGDGTGTPIPVSGNKIGGTGTLIGKVFDLIAQAREKDLWRLEEQEIKSLNNTCPKILPRIISQNSGLIGCILSLLGIIVKRLKKERAEVSETESPIAEQVIEETENKPLTGGRND